MRNTKYAVHPQGLALPKFVQSCLTEINKHGYAIDVTAKSVTGIGLPFHHKAHSRQLFAGFFMRTICARLCNSLGELHQNYGGLVEGASAHRFLMSGKTNLDQSTTHKIGLFGGGYKNHHKEAVAMTTIPTQAVTTAMIYTFAIAGGSRLLSDFKRIRTVSAFAKSEQEARHALLGLPLVFVCRTPTKAQEVAA
ncbi:ash family protein [Vibrio metschnikovii]|uniref:ash family protein n=1 Tax=Vibrio metschnikovii TaxID=28172 RepID=UPI001C30CC60|nr:ash family protein [Vibrio metschnikovii]